MYNVIKKEEKKEEKEYKVSKVTKLLKLPGNTCFSLSHAL